MYGLTIHHETGLGNPNLVAAVLPPPYRALRG